MKAMNYHEQDGQELTAVTAINDGGLDWLEDSISLLSADGDLSGSYGWWGDPLPAQQDDIGSVVAQTLSPPAALTTGSPLAHASPTSIASPAPSSKKRKSPASGSGGHSHSGSNQRRRAEQDRERPAGGGGKKSGSKGGGSDRDARWAEQLLSPCAVAVEARNLSRVQHLFYVLGELASFSGDANHRLAAYGLRALSLRLPAEVGAAAAAAVRVPAMGSCAECPSTFAAAEPRLFRASLIRFHEVSPWFALPNALANAAIAQQVQAPRPLHLIDIGVSHGVQWPTLLEFLTRLPAGRAPQSVRLTVVAAAPTRAPAAPFSASPSGYDFAPHLLRYAKSINLELDIARAASLDDLSVRGGIQGEEALVVVCLQFRLGHVTPEERTDVLRKVRDLKPDLVVLSELDVVVGGSGAAGEFSARLELLWRFLESSSAAFKGRDGEDRRLLEAEAGAPTAITASSGEGREAWRERMRAAGFQEAAFGGEAVESARSLLRKYDSGWEMAGGIGAAVALRWKGQPVSFCSLWRPAPP